MISQDYIDSLPEIYRDILRTYAMFSPPHRLTDGLAFQTLYSGLDDRYSLAEIRMACERMADAGVLEIRNGIFAHPTPVGVEIINRLTEGQTARVTVPEFPPLPQEAARS